MPVVIDALASQSTTQGVIDNECPTIARVRGGSFGYWCSLKGPWLDVNELSLLQGFEPSDIDWNSAKVTKNQFGACLGNAQSLNVLCAIAPYLLYSCKQIPNEECMSMTR